MVFYIIYNIINHNQTLCINDLCSFYFLLYEYNLNGIIYYTSNLSKWLYELNNNKVEYRYLNMNNIKIRYLFKNSYFLFIFYLLFVF